MVACPNTLTRRRCEIVVRPVRRFELLMETKFGSRKSEPFCASVVDLKSDTWLPRMPPIEMSFQTARELIFSSVWAVMLRVMSSAMSRTPL